MLTAKVLPIKKDKLVLHVPVEFEDGKSKWTETFIVSDEAEVKEKVWAYVQQFEKIEAVDDKSLKGAVDLSENRAALAASKEIK